jgi:serine/threonine protein kinase
VSIRRCPRCQLIFEPPARFCARDGTPLTDVEVPRSTSSPDVSEPPVPSLTLNQVIDARYKVVRRLGEGGMSYVYQGRDQVENTDVAIKVLTPRLATDPGSVERLRREALLAMRFDHPNVCRILHVGETTDGMLYLIMPYLRGESLNDAETRRGPYPVGEAVMLLVQVCHGLQHAHDVGVIHRDLKPENIMLVLDDSVAGGIRAVVMDFGLGKAIQPDPELVRLTQTGIILGTPEFMSPEQVRGDKIDGRSDVFSLGVVAFELFTGQLPFAGRTSQESMIARLRGKPRSPRSVRPDLPARADTVLMRALALKTDQRYQTMQAFGEDLSTIEQKGFLRRLFRR